MLASMPVPSGCSEEVRECFEESKRNTVTWQVRANGTVVLEVLVAKFYWFYTRSVGI